MIAVGRKENIAVRIRTMRKSRGLTHEELAKMIGQSASSISMYENGRREPNFETLESIADVFNVPLVSLMIDPDSELSEEEKNWSHYVQGRLDSHIPQTSEARILARGIDRLPPDERKKALDMARVMFAEYAEYFKENDDETEL